MSQQRIREALASMAQLSGRTIGQAAADMLLEDLKAYPTDLVLEALSKCRREIRGFPCLAEIVARIEDGRPGVEEAWGMIPKDESESVVWTGEIRQAFHAARTLIDEDPIAARMAFKEVYLKAVTEARANMLAVRWEPSLGHNPEGREHVLKLAVEKGRLSLAHAEGLKPHRTPPAGQITGPSESDLTPLDPKEVVARIRAMLAKGGSS